MSLVFSLLSMSATSGHRIVIRGGGGQGQGQGVCVCVCVCVDFQLKHCGFDPRRVRFHTSSFSFSISGWLPTAKCVCLCMSEYMWEKKRKKKGIVTGQNQPLRAVWCNTRLLNSGGQFDQTCNLFGGAIPAQGLC